MSKIDFKVEAYNGAMFNGKYMVRNTNTGTSIYLYNDGIVRDWALNGTDSDAIAMYDTKEGAERALMQYRGEIMTLSKLKTGMMVVTRNGDTWVVMLGTTGGDILTMIGNNGFLRFEDYDDNLLDIEQDNEYDIVEVYDEPTSSGQIGKTFGKKLWTLPVPDTVMTISELEKKYGITNLKIVKEAV